jgi:folate-dependent phosphoribosylglycinamide formyltransferase PurN
MVGLLNQLPNSEISILLHEKLSMNTKKLTSIPWIFSSAMGAIDIPNDKYVTPSGIYEAFSELLGTAKCDQYKNALSDYIDLHPEKLLRTTNLNSVDFLSQLEQQKFDVGIARGGGILRKKFIESFRLGILNLHGAGPLPYYRGLGSLEFALVEGQPLYLNIHYIDSGIDTGPVLEKIPFHLDGINNLNHLYAKIHIMGIDALVSMTSKLMGGTIEAISQKVEDGRQHFIPHPVFEKLAQERLISRVRLESRGM